LTPRSQPTGLARFCAACIAVFGALSNPASAEPRNFAGTLSVGVGDSVDPGLVFPSGGVAQVNDDFVLTSLDLGDPMLGGTLVQLVTDPGQVNTAAVRVEIRLGSGTLGFQPFASRLDDGILPLPGALRICLLSTNCISELRAPFTGITTNGPVGLGIGGTVRAGLQGPVRFSVQGAPWTVRTATAAVPTVSGSVLATSRGFVHGPLSFSFSPHSIAFVHSPTSATASVGGEIQLVTPFRIESSIADAQAGGFVRVKVRFLPEPSLLLLLGSAVGSLLVLARLQRRA